MKKALPVDLRCSLCGKLAFLFFAFCALRLCANTEIVWVGGDSGNLFEKSNWYPQITHTKENADYVAVFTNSATITTETTETYWRPAGVRVSDGVTVSVDLGVRRFMPAIGGDGKTVEFWIGADASFTLMSDYFYANGVGYTFRKTGAGALVQETKTAGGGIPAGKTYANFEVLEGEMTTPGVPATNIVKIASAATLKLSKASGFPKVSGLLIEVDGTLDGGGLNHTLSTLAGEGIVENAGEGVLTLVMGRSGEMFSGLISGKLAVIPSVGVTPADAIWIVGAAETLSNAEFSVSAVAGTSAEVRFASGIGVFLAKTYPQGRFYDMDGKKVELCCHAWYVDSRKQESGDGRSWATAFNTLADAFSNSGLAEFDKVFAKPGTYDAGLMARGSDATTNRVVIAKNVSLVSMGSYRDTFIVGAASVAPSANKGCGLGAVRCVYLQQGAGVCGFTLTGGHTAGSEVGGGVMAVDTTSRIVDCVISNNVAYRGGAGVRGTYVRCGVLNNKKTDLGGGVLYGFYAYDSYFDSNEDRHYIAGNSAGFWNCTFGANDGVIDPRTASGTSVQAYNTVFLSKISGNSGIVNLHNCLALSGTNALAVADERTLITNIVDVSERMAYAGLDEDLRPVSVGGAVVDSGDNSFMSETTGGLDGDCGQRIYNGIVDIGAFEHDWRPDFAGCLTKSSKLDVVRADPNVTIRECGGVEIAIGSTLDCKWVNGRKHLSTYSFCAKVDGLGALSCKCNGAEVCCVRAVDGEVRFEFHNDCDVNELEFSYSGESGLASVYDLTRRSDMGIILIVR